MMSFLLVKTEPLFSIIVVFSMKVAFSMCRGNLVTWISWGVYIEVYIVFVANVML